MPVPYSFPSKVGCFIKLKLNIVKGYSVKGKESRKPILITSEE